MATVGGFNLVVRLANVAETVHLLKDGHVGKHVAWTVFCQYQIPLPLVYLDGEDVFNLQGGIVLQKVYTLTFIYIYITWKRVVN